MLHAILGADMALLAAHLCMFLFSRIIRVLEGNWWERGLRITLIATFRLLGDRVDFAEWDKDARLDQS
jgi:hypothetical protein